MKTMLVAARETPQAWAEALTAALPAYDVRLAAPQDRPVQMLVVGTPWPGLVRSLPGLEIILSLNAGVEALLSGGEVPAGVPIVKMADDGLRLGMIEWVLAQALAWHRNLFLYDRDQADRLWSPRDEKLARERCVTVLGAGALGAPVAQALAAVGFRTRIWARTARQIDGVEVCCGSTGLIEAVSGADILVNLLPRTSQTDGLIDGALLARLAPGALLINAGRGATLRDADVLAALDSGILSCAALDVFVSEPLPAEHRYWSHPQVRMSPHVAAPTFIRTAVAHLVKAVGQWERGEPLDHLAEPRRGW